MRPTQSMVDNMINYHNNWANGRTSGERAVFAKMDLSGLVIKSRSMTGMDFSYANLSNSHLEYNYAGTLLHHEYGHNSQHILTAYTTNFTGANLYGARIVETGWEKLHAIWLGAYWGNGLHKYMKGVFTNKRFEY